MTIWPLYKIYESYKHYTSYANAICLGLYLGGFIESQARSIQVCRLGQHAQKNGSGSRRPEALQRSVSFYMKQPCKRQDHQKRLKCHKTKEANSRKAESTPSKCQQKKTRLALKRQAGSLQALNNLFGNNRKRYNLCYIYMKLNINFVFTGLTKRTLRQLYFAFLNFHTGFCDRIGDITCANRTE